MKRVTDVIINKLRSPKFFVLTVVIFLAQGLFFALAVNPSSIYVLDSGLVTRGGGVVPDGNRHIGAIYYFANQPLKNGPFITDQTDEELWMGDLERFPSYLYYYLTSFPVRAAEALDASDAVKVFVIRLTGLLFGLISLVVFKRIVKELKLGELIVNLSTFALAITGSFAWLAPAENYDILALLFFFLFILSSVRLYTRRDTRQLYFMVLWFFLGGITKYTYIPFMGFAGILSLLLLTRAVGYAETLRLIKKQTTEWLKTKKIVAVLVAIVIIIAGGLFAERVGRNLVEYQSFNPSCSVVHTHEACMTFGVYERNFNQSQKIESGEVKRATYNPITYTGFWIARYFTSMYAYVGHIWIYQFWPLMIAGGVVGVIGTLALFVYVKRKRQKILTSSAQWYIFAVTGVLILAQYIFNLRTYINFGGQAYAHQGRYLLSAIGFVYVLILLVASAAYRVMPEKTKRWVAPSLIFICLLGLFTLSALPVFLVHANTPEWYSPLFRGLFW